MIIEKKSLRRMVRFVIIYVPPLSITFINSIDFTINTLTFAYIVVFIISKSAPFHFNRRSCSKYSWTCASKRSSSRLLFASDIGTLNLAISSIICSVFFLKVSINRFFATIGPEEIIKYWADDKTECITKAKVPNLGSIFLFLIPFAVKKLF